MILTKKSVQNTFVWYVGVHECFQVATILVLLIIVLVIKYFSFSISIMAIIRFYITATVHFLVYGMMRTLTKAITFIHFIQACEIYYFDFYQLLERKVITHDLFEPRSYIFLTNLSSMMRKGTETRRWNDTCVGKRETFLVLERFPSDPNVLAF